VSVAAWARTAVGAAAVKLAAKRSGAQAVAKMARRRFVVRGVDKGWRITAVVALSATWGWR
jgi:hypothetical protein